MLNCINSFLLRLVQSNVFITILSGSIVFIITQYYLEMYLKPKRNLHDKYAHLCEIMLQNHAQYINGNLTDIEIEKIKTASSELLSAGWQLYKRKSIRMRYISISKEINGIVANSLIEKPSFENIQQSIKNIESLDKNIKITYQTFD